jgi:hypothetical protein
MSEISVDFGPLGPSGKASEPEPEGLPWNSPPQSNGAST